MYNVLYTKCAYWQDLIEVFNSELGGHLKTLIIALMDSKAVYNAHCLRKAMKGLGTDESVLIEILCTRTNQVGFIWKKRNLLYNVYHFRKLGT